MINSLPSSKVVLVDVPEVDSFSGGFVYNFFARDEKINDSGNVGQNFIDGKDPTDFDSSFIGSKNFNRFAPRYVKFQWQSLPNQNEFIRIDKISIKENLSKIHIENDFTSEVFHGYSIQDNDNDKKMNFFVRKLIAEQRNSEETTNQNDVQQESYLDSVKLTKTKTSNGISSNLLSEAIANNNIAGHIYLDSTGKPIETQSILNELNNIKTFARINKKFAKNIFGTIRENSFSFFEDEAKNLIRQSEQDEADLMGRSNSSILTAEEFDFEIEDYIDYKLVDTNGYEPKKQILGYIIDKYEIKDKNIIEHTPIIVENPNINSTVDLKVKYGARYVYSIRSVYYMESQAEDTDAGEIVILSYLISSKPSRSVVVDCIEAVPPPPPSDFDVKWDFKDKFPILVWNFPVNKQQDIKKWQIFKRKTIKEPYELIKVYDFDNSLNKQNSDYEYMDPILIQTMENPKTTFTDRSFKVGDVAIYTVCSMDAHGFSSNYGIQFEVEYDRFKNKIKKKLISRSGAPKAYPNYFIQQDAFVDTIRDSGHKKLHIFFTPEYMKVLDTQENDLKLLNFDKINLETDNRNRYVISMINVDLQEQANINIKLSDRRSSMVDNMSFAQKRLNQNSMVKFKKNIKK